MNLRTLTIAAPLLTACIAPIGHCAEPTVDAISAGPVSNGYEWLPVSGTGVHYFTSAIVHSVEPTPNGFIQRSSETVELDGDLVGRILYHPVSVFDFVAGTLVNTGNQAFSGTVLGSEPVLLHDDEFRFESDLMTGQTVGSVLLIDHLAGPKIRCRLDVLGDGESTPEGDAVVTYTGECRVRVQSPR